MTRNTKGRIELLEVIDAENNQEGSILQRTQKTFIFDKSREFILLRWLLRGLSLWYPKSRCCLSRYFYPGFVSFLFACTTACYVVIFALKEDTDVTYNILVVVIFTGGYFSQGLVIK
jgi:hypothetical protein